jgi:hypothetical protein
VNAAQHAHAAMMIAATRLLLNRAVISAAMLHFPSNIRADTAVD